MPAQYSTKTKTNKTLYAILSIRLLFGLYCKFNCSKTVCWIAKLFCVFCILLLLLLVIGIYFTLPSFSLYPVLLLKQSLVHTIASLLTEEENFVKFVTILQNESPNAYVVPQSNYALYISILLMVFMRYLAFATVGSMIMKPLVLVSLSYGYFTCCSAFFTTIYATDAYRQNIYCLKKTLCHELSANVSEEQKIKAVKYFIDIYIKITKGVTDLWDVTARTNILFGGAVWCVHATTAIMFVTVIPWSASILPWDLSSVAMIVICLPIIITEVMTYHLDGIKRLFSKEILILKDRRYRRTLRDALEYMDACAARYTLWNHFPLSVSSLFGFFNICISYIIVILQFSY